VPLLASRQVAGCLILVLVSTDIGHTETSRQTDNKDDNSDDENHNSSNNDNDNDYHVDDNKAVLLRSFLH
jgi:hypothetical protein